MRTLAVALISLALSAQSPKAKIESCGGGSKPACHCLQRTDKIQVQAAEVCNGPHWRDFYKTQVECFHAKLSGLDHCSIAESWSRYDEDSGVAEEQDGRIVSASTMGPMCSMACKKHDCKCDADGPTCHYGHNASDHKGEK
jgi:hypothetical protein